MRSHIIMALLLKSIQYYSPLGRVSMYNTIPLLTQIK